jgi:hypothetical protein
VEEGLNKNNVDGPCVETIASALILPQSANAARVPTYLTSILVFLLPFKKKTYAYLFQLKEEGWRGAKSDDGVWSIFKSSFSFNGPLRE